MVYIGKKCNYSSKYYDLGFDGMILLNGKPIDELILIRYWLKMSKIEWTDKTWNVVTGCTQISPACKNCYAKAMGRLWKGS